MVDQGKLFNRRKRNEGPDTRKPDTQGDKAQAVEPPGSKTHKNGPYTRSNAADGHQAR